MKTGQIMDIALKAGEILLVSGAEIYRVEDTILRIFKSYRGEGDCFVVLSGIFLSLMDRDTEIHNTKVKRIKGHSGNLKRIELVNSFSRWIEKETPAYEEAMKALAGIESSPVYSLPVRSLAAGLTAFVYTVLFRGSVPEGAAAFCASLLIYLIKTGLSSLGLFLFMEFFVSGLIAGLAAVLFSVYLDMDIYRLLTGAIMILVPGVAITNGLKDALHGDIVSSLYRLAEAFFISVAVGGGVGISLVAGSRLL